MKKKFRYFLFFVIYVAVMDSCRIAIGDPVKDLGFYFYRHFRAAGKAAQSEAEKAHQLALQSREAAIKALKDKKIETAMKHEERAQDHFLIARLKSEDAMALHGQALSVFGQHYSTPMPSQLDLRLRNRVDKCFKGYIQANQLRESCLNDLR